MREASHWSSWAGTIKMVKARQSGDVAETILAAVEARDEVPSVQAINTSVESLVEVGFVAPNLEELARETDDPPNAENADPNQPRADGAMLYFGLWPVLLWPVVLWSNFILWPSPNSATTTKTLTLNPKFPPSACQRAPTFSGQASPEAGLCATQF